MSSFEITPEMQAVPNDWCLLDKDNKLVDRDINLSELIARNDLDEYIICKNWLRPQPHE